MPERVAPEVALLWHGDHDTRESATLSEHRLRDVADALRHVGVSPVPAVYDDAVVEEVREQLLKVDGVLVWVNPIENNHDRSVLDGMLREVADAGVVVSSHPDVIQKMGTKEVLFRTRDMDWGCDTSLYTSAKELRDQFPLRLAGGKPRVLKQHRGNGGNGVWKVELASRIHDRRLGSNGDQTPLGPTPVRVRHALRGSIEETMSLSVFLDQCETQFSNGGRMIDQAYQDRLPEGMIRCYLVRDEVVGFGHQKINALFPAAPGMAPHEAPEPGPRLYYPATKPEFQALKTKMEQGWVTTMRRRLDIGSHSLPVIWDADFLLGPKDQSGEDTYVLCEINVSSVYPFPDEALPALAVETRNRLQAAVRLGRSIA